MIVERRSGIRAHGNRNTPAEGGAETSLVLFHHVPRLGAGAVRNAAAGRAGRCGGEGRQRRYHIDVALGHHLRRVVVHEGGMFDGVDARAEGVLHPGCAVGMGGHMSPVGDGHFDGSGQFCHGHLRVVRRGAGGEHAAGGNDFDDFGAGIELIQDGCADGLDSVGFAADEARMSAGHADRETGGKNTWPRRQSGLDGLFQGEHRMVPESHIPDSGEPGVESAARQLGGFEQGDGRRFSLHRSHDIRLRSQTKVNVAIDQAGKDGQAAAVDSLRALGEPNIPFGPDGLDAGALDEEGASLNPVTEAVQNADLTDGDGHGASLIGMVTMTPPMMSLSL
ncbi:hypothetical protein NSND_60822 [Nitrospira sp. ND1]|nr:hypothetical protein NSND_60822 [Nitrospira sp. ND1]